MRKWIWSVVTLVGGYIGFQLIADVAATRLVEVWGFTIPAGTFVFALTFTWRDALHKRLGKEWARAAIVLAGVVNLIMAAYFSFAGNLNVPIWIDPNDAGAWSAIFAFVPAIVIGSILAEVVSEWVDTEVYHAVRLRFEGKWQFVRVLLSNAVSLPLDSIIFGSLAFVLLPAMFGGDPLPWVALPPIIIGQVAFKGVVTIVSLPLIYAVPERAEHEMRWLDEMIARESETRPYEMGGSLDSGRVKPGNEL